MPTMEGYSASKSSKKQDYLYYILYIYSITTKKITAHIR